MPVIRYDGADLDDGAHGTGQPIVPLHDTTAGLQSLEPQPIGLADGCRVVDERGTGSHTLPTRPATTDRPRRGPARR